jgi:hypothetical protein
MLRRWIRKRRLRRLLAEVRRLEIRIRARMETGYGVPTSMCESCGRSTIGCDYAREEEDLRCARFRLMVTRGRLGELPRARLAAVKESEKEASS